MGGRGNRKKNEPTESRPRESTFSVVTQRDFAKYVGNVTTSKVECAELNWKANFKDEICYTEAKKCWYNFWRTDEMVIPAGLSPEMNKLFRYVQL